MSADDHLNDVQFLPARQVREQFRPSPHELYNEFTGEPWMHPDDTENLRMTREFKLNQAKKPYDEGEPEGPNNLSLVNHIKTKGFPGTVLLDTGWHSVVDGNHRLEAAHHLDPDFPVPVTYKKRR